MIRDNIVALRAGAAARLVTGKVAQVLAGRRRAARTTWCSPIRRTRVTDEEVD